MQQSIAIGRPMLDVLDAFEHQVLPDLPVILASRWGEQGTVCVGSPRRRAGGSVYALSWPARRDIRRPEVDMDLEIAPLDENATHLQLSGQLQLPWVERWSDDERTAERHCTIALASILDEIGARLYRGAMPAG